MCVIAPPGASAPVAEVRANGDKQQSHFLGSHPAYVALIMESLCSK